ncbi:hypothetical protein BPOR_0128g00100 [Botrytis porri]|uniref:Uncharacterized protein n=1 Tax=Botrytis porri TaxID=87229 RepID=A0A4Z1KX52_9HELO|nr:hypothetical protein BPOR_0128g00100 [Botrytis porri]
MTGYVCVRTVRRNSGGYEEEEEEEEEEKKSRKWVPVVKISTWLMTTLCVMYKVGGEENGSVQTLRYGEELD